MTAAALALDAVSFSYGERTVVVEVSLSARAGRVVGLLGPNGAGKSTVLRLAAGLLRPRTGTVRLGDEEMAAMGRRQLARSVALVPQEAGLADGFTGRDTVALGRSPYLGWFATPGVRDAVAERRALALADAEPFAERRVETLSGGERRRLVLARALAQEPCVLLLDEPAAHLDLTHALAMLDTVRRLAREDGLAVLAVLHDLNLASEFCDELVVMAAGTVVARGTPTEVIRAETLRAVYGRDLPVARHPVSGRPMVLVGVGSRGKTAAADRIGKGDRGVADGADTLDGVGSTDRGPVGEADASQASGDPASLMAPPDAAGEPFGGPASEQPPTGSRSGRRGLVIVNTGHGKGKTSAALGVTMRAWGQGLRPIVLQFVKAKTGNWGEVRAARKMGIEVIPLGAGFTWTSKDLEQDKALAREGWDRCQAAVLGGDYDLVVLDELTYCFHFGWLDLNEVLDTLRARPIGQHVIVTGRDAPRELVEFADLVTEMKEVKHPFQLGIKARKGIDF